MVLLVFLQTSSRDAVRGYLLRGLAFRFRSPLVWAQLPLFVFTVLHWSAASSSLNAAVWLPSAPSPSCSPCCPRHRKAQRRLRRSPGNNLTGFLFISHQTVLVPRAVFRPSGGCPGWSGHDALLIAAIGLGCTALTALLLLHRRSPLKIEPTWAARTPPSLTSPRFPV